MKKQCSKTANYTRGQQQDIVEAFKDKWDWDWVNEQELGQVVYTIQMPKHIKTLKGLCEKPPSFWDEVSEEKEFSYHEPVKFMKLFELEQK